MDVSLSLSDACGRPWWLRPFEDWTVAEMRPEFLSVTLDGIVRFGNKCPLVWNLTRHQLLVEKIMPPTASRQQRLLALTHDVHEIFSGEVPRDAKENFRLAIEDYQDRVDHHILPMLGVDVEAGRAGGMVADADRRAAELEVQWGERFHKTKSLYSIPEWPRSLFENSRNNATQWLERFRELSESHEQNELSTRSVSAAGCD